MAFRRVRRSCVQRAVIYGPLATIPYTYERHTRYAFSISSVHGGEPERAGHTRHFLVQRWAASFHRCLLRASRRHRVMRRGSFFLFHRTITGGKRDAVGAAYNSCDIHVNVAHVQVQRKKNKIAKWTSLLRRESNAVIKSLRIPASRVESLFCFL